jgi:hypothetical protein
MIFQEESEDNEAAIGIGVQGGGGSAPVVITRRSTSTTHATATMTTATTAVTGGYDDENTTVRIPTNDNHHNRAWKNRTSTVSNRISNVQGRGKIQNGHNSHPLLSHNMHMSPAVYLQRMMDISQMDIQSAMDQMKSLLVPSKINTVYKMAYYRKQTKNHWARDDPAFVFLQIIFLATVSLAYAIAFRSDSLVANFLYFSFHGIIVNFGLLGLAMAFLARYLANQYLNQTNGVVGGDGHGVVGGDGHGVVGGEKGGTMGISAHHSSARRPQYYVRQSVEFMYAFDVHCNAFFVLFVVIYGLQFFLLPLVLGKGFMSFLVSNALYSVGFFGYFYVTHLGYRGK